jgi:hypothetical protein
MLAWMAIGLWIKFDDGTAEQYDAVEEELGVEDNPPDGLIFHSAGPVPGGWNVVDVWESRGHFDRFQEERLGPALEAVGDAALPGPPSINEFEVHNFVKP